MYAVRVMTSDDAYTSGTSRVLTVASLQQLKMEALIPAPADCEVRSVVKFLNALSIEPIKIHHQLCQVYGPNVMSKQAVRCWCKKFTADWLIVHDEERSVRLSIITEDLVELVREWFMENRRFTITELTSHFPMLVQNCIGAPVVRKIVSQVGAKATDIRTQSKVHGISIYISAAVPWWWRRVSGSDHRSWWNVGCTNYHRNQAVVNALVSQ